MDQSYMVAEGCRWHAKTNGNFQKSCNYKNLTYKYKVEELNLKIRTHAKRKCYRKEMLQSQKLERVAKLKNSVSKKKKTGANI